MPGHVEMPAGDGAELWLYTNRHLKPTRELQAQARQLAETLEKRTQE
jgi:hypothetical protein